MSCRSKAVQSFIISHLMHDEFLESKSLNVLDLINLIFMFFSSLHFIDKDLKMCSSTGIGSLGGC